MAHEVVLTTNELKEGQRCNLCNLSLLPDIIQIRKARVDFRRPGS